MKVSIQLDKVGGDPDLFTCTDWLSGNVTLALRRADAVSQVTISLQGKLLSCVIAAITNPKDHLQAVDEHKLFKLSRVVFPPANVPLPSIGFSLPEGVTTIPFRFRFPVLSTCQNPNPQNRVKHVETTLPPSFNYQSTKNDGNAMVNYYLRVKVRRPGRFKSDLVVKQFIKFMPLDPALPPPMMEPTRIKSTQVLKFELPSAPRRSSPSSPLVVDARSVTLSTALPTPAVLRIGSGLPLEVSLLAKAGMTTIPPLFIRSLTINLLTETTITVGLNLKTWPTCKELLTANFAMQLNADEEHDISKELWKKTIIPKVLTPSFTTCTLMQQHFIQILVGVSFGEKGSLSVMKTMINVELHSGVEARPPPLESMSPDEENEDEIGFVPWRVGSESHLGILGRHNSIPDDALPPPY